MCTFILIFPMALSVSTEFVFTRRYRICVFLLILDCTFLNMMKFETLSQWKEQLYRFSINVTWSVVCGELILKRKKNISKQTNPRSKGNSMLYFWHRNCHSEVPSLKIIKFLCTRFRLFHFLFALELF